jgi:hypothetical protein
MPRPRRKMKQIPLFFAACAPILSGAMVTYRFILSENQVIQITVDRQRRPDAPPTDMPHADWTRLPFHQCDHCPLPCSDWAYCPAALDLEQIVAQFGDLLSFDRARVEVIAPERTYLKECDLQTALRLLLGLVMATSPCPVLSQFRGLAASHLPFATLEETLFRTAGAYLLKQYFLHQAGKPADMDLKGLDAFYQELQRVNRCFKRRLDSAAAKDANLNAIGSLLYISMVVSCSIEEQLTELRETFCPKG